ncbi:MAG TPA: T9SS type A sorting domain-containing protein [Candidatus Kapabacteria bacterium]
MDIAFKDSLTAWIATNSIDGCYKTSDGGNTWQGLNGPYEGGAVYYDSVTKGLFLARWLSSGQFVSWDEGLTWAVREEGDPTGYAFFDGNIGILAGQGGSGTFPPPAAPWLRTEDGGYTWNPISLDSESWQPLAILNTKTSFDISDYSGTVSRTDDAWDTWKNLYTFPRNTNQDQYTAVSGGCITGDTSHLFVQVGSGVYMSTDQGYHWSYLCGQPSLFEVADRRFFVKYPYVYITTFDTAFESSVWYLNLDSLNVFGTSFALPDSVKRTTVTAGNKVAVNFSPQTSDPIGIDSGHILIHFDSADLTLDSLALPPSWVIVDSSMGSGYLDLHITADSNAPLPNPIITLTFNTFVGDSSLSAKVWLDSAHLYGHRLNCDCEALSFLGPDSVEVDFTGCGDSILLETLRGEPFTFSIQSIIPNPANASVRVEGNGQSVTAELDDALGRESLPAALYSFPFTLDIRTLPSGTYYLRISQNGSVQTRKVAIER